MPRKKVDPSKRVRIARACTKCQAAKKKCDGKQPCSLCIRKNKEPECTFGHESSHEASQEPQSLDEVYEDSPGETRHRLNSRILKDSRGEKGELLSSMSFAD